MGVTIPYNNVDDLASTTGAEQVWLLPSSITAGATLSKFIFLFPWPVPGAGHLRGKTPGYSDSWHFCQLPASQFRHNRDGKQFVWVIRYAMLG